MKKNSSFGRHRGPRKALLRGLVSSLVEQERIKTTLPKAKIVAPLAEKAVTLGKKGSLHSRRLLMSRYPKKQTVDKIINDLSVRFKDRKGGYTRIIKLGFRSGDQASLAYLEFVDYTAKPKLKKIKKEEKESEKSDSASKKKASKSKEQVKAQKLQSRKLDQKRKKLRQQQKKSRRINRKS